MPDTTWNPPTGPPNGVPLRPADARRELTEALDAAQARDRELRAELVALATARVRVGDRLSAATGEATDARELAKRALTRSRESARDGQRADAARWTAAAQVFAVRLVDARALVADLERQLAAGAERAQWAETALDVNVGRLQAVAAARLPLLTGRRGGRAQVEVDETVAALAVSADEEVARAIDAARADAARAAETPSPVDVAPVSDDDLDAEVDLGRADDVLDELRSELGLGPPAAGAGATAPRSAAPDPASSSGPASASGPAGAAGTEGPSPPVHAARR